MSAACFDALTIVTSCRGYGQYLTEWADSIVRQTVKPGRVCLFTHGSSADEAAGVAAWGRLTSAGIAAAYEHSWAGLDFGAARNRAVAMSRTEWVMHLDADDMLTPRAVEEFQQLAPGADVIQAGYERTGHIVAGPSKRARLYQSADGLAALDLPSMASGVSPFRRALWEQAPYREDMLGAWDTAMWIRFAQLGARFRATTRPAFYYRQHADSVFNKRRTVLGWPRVHTTAMLRQVRAQRSGVDIIVPRSAVMAADRERVWGRVKAHYAAHHPEWGIVEGRSAGAVWVKGAAIADALRHSAADVIVLADADCMVDPDALRESVNAVVNGAPWAMPHTMVHRATEAWTTMALALGSVVDLQDVVMSALDRPAYEGAPGGGIVVLRRVNYDAIGGIPLAFRGWGSEDRALATLCGTLLGPCVRGTADLLHLWHAPQPNHGRPNSNLQLLRRLGHAALAGNDPLVAMAYTLPNPGNRPMLANAQLRRNHGTARPAVPVTPVPVAAMAARQARRQAILQKRRAR